MSQAELHMSAANPTRRCRAAPSSATMLALGCLALAFFGAAAPLHAQQRPVLVVGGHATTSAVLDKSVEWLGKKGFKATGLELLAEEGWNWPGTASNEESAMSIAYAVEIYRDAMGVDKIDIIAISQGILAARYYMKELGGDAYVAGVFSWSGVNSGVPLDYWTEPTCTATPHPAVCDEVVYTSAPGDTAWLMELNEDPTPGAADYYHLYTDTQEPPSDPSKFAEIIELPGAINARVQDYCPGRKVYHAGYGVDWLTDRAMGELLVHALNRTPLATACPCQVPRYDLRSDRSACTPPRP